MAQEIHQYTATIPAKTPKSALYTSVIPLQGYEIESVDLEVAPGPAGLMGFYLARSGQQWLPFEAGEFLVWDNRFDSWYLSDQPSGTGWQIVGYNLDAFAHNVVARFHVNSPNIAPVSAPALSIITTNVTPILAIL